MPILRLIALLLEYPDPHLWDNREEALAMIARDAQPLLGWATEYVAAPLIDRQSEWCDLFERGSSTSLLLFEHVHGESRDRGQAMVDLLGQYAQAGLELGCRELPDHLPLYLEYLAQLPQAEAIGGLQDVAPILALLSARLSQRESRYAVLFDVLLAVANSAVDSDKVAAKIADEARDDTPQALDAVWEEEQVKFFADQGCADSDIAAHQRRFAGAVAPQYLNISNGGER